MTEQDRIQSIKRNRFSHIKTFKPENITYAMCLAAVRGDSQALEFVPFEMRTKELCDIAVNQNGMTLRFVPQSLKTRELCIRAVRKNWEAYEYVPKDIFTYDFIMEASNNGEFISTIYIRHMKAKDQSPELYQDLISNGGPNYIFSVPKKYLNKKIGQLAIEASGLSTASELVRKKPEIFTCLHPSLCDYESCKIYASWIEMNEPLLIPPRGYYYPLMFGYKHLLQWPDIAVQYLKKNPGLLKDVPQGTLTEEMCLLALENDKRREVFPHIPVELRTQKVCEVAYKMNPCYIEGFPEESISSEMAWRAVREDGDYLQYVPDHLKTEELCLEAMKDSGTCLKYVPENLKTREMCVLAAKSGYPPVREYIPVKFLDKEICMSAIFSLREVPKEFLDYDFCYKRVSRSGSVIHEVPDEYIDENMCIAALKNGTNPDIVFERLSADKFTSEIVNYARSYNDLKYIPRELQSEEICAQIFMNEVKMEKYIICNSDHIHRDRAFKALESFPEEILTQHFFDIVFEKQHYSIEYFPEQMITMEMLLHIAKVAPFLLSRVNFPEKFKNIEDLDKLVEQNPEAELYIEQYRK